LDVDLMFEIGTPLFNFIKGNTRQAVQSNSTIGFNGSDRDYASRRPSLVMTSQLETRLTGSDPDYASRRPSCRRRFRSTSLSRSCRGSTLNDVEPRPSEEALSVVEPSCRGSTPPKVLPAQERRRARSQELSRSCRDSTTLSASQSAMIG
jgi:hypothetical protein